MNDDDILNEFYELIGEERDYVTKRENEELNKIYTKSMSLVDELLKNIEDETKRKKISEMMDDYNVKIDEYYFKKEQKSFISGYEYGVKLMAALYNRNR